MRQSIITYFIGPTNYRGSRIKAKASGGSSVTLDWDHAMNPAGNHRAAAKAPLTSWNGPASLSRAAWRSGSPVWAIA
jgi:hypothetical protein